MTISRNLRKLAAELKNSQETTMFIFKALSPEYRQIMQKMPVPLSLVLIDSSQGPGPSYFEVPVRYSLMMEEYLESMGIQYESEPGDLA